MRNWNIWPNWSSPKIPMVFSLPMRNWNSFPDNVREIPARFLVYLWGIETKKGPWKNNCRMGFLVYLWGIETIYAWGAWSKDRGVFSLPMRNWNWCTCCTWSVMPPVFSLPMRNWNEPSPAANPWSRQKFLVYLWGIETQHTCIFSNYYLKFLVYLWGIETPASKYTTQEEV